jgi:molybdenum cofactor cytidylyltransferase
MIDAIVLAAGESRRMGRPKPLLPFEGTTFLGQIISVLAASDINAITVVLGAEADQVTESVDLSDVRAVVNKDYQKGQLSSLVAAMVGIHPQTDAILLCLVDHPFITTQVVDAIANKFAETSGRIIVPVFNSHRGHPTLFARPLFGQLLNAPEDRGARHVLYSNESEVLELETSDSGILIGIDTPEDYARHFGRAP